MKRYPLYWSWSKFRALLQDSVVEISAEATRNPHQRGFVSRGKALEVAFFPGASNVSRSAEPSRATDPRTASSEGPLLR